MKNRLVANWKRSRRRLYIVTLLFNLYTEYIICNSRLDEAQAGIKTSGRNITNLRWHHSYGRKRKGTKEPLDESKRGEWKTWLKTQHSKNKDHGIQSHHFMANEGEKVEALIYFLFLDSKITADGDRSHQIKKCLLLGRKFMTNLDSILKGKEITLLTKVHLIKIKVFPVVMYGCENWTIKKAEHWRTDAFELWCWRWPLRVPWTARSSNQSILKEISPEYSLEGLMLKLKLQYFGHLMQRTDSLEKILMLGQTEGGRRRRWQRMRWLGWHHWLNGRVWANLRCWSWAGRPGMLQSMQSQRVGHNWVTELNCTELKAPKKVWSLGSHK